jgi:L-ascorbate metabolism protein UlaG (beta-lactamase superfamily)
LKKPPQVDLILASHGHMDHIGDLVACARASGAPVVAIVELCDWLARKGIQNVVPMNRGGSQEIAGLGVTMTDARHSSGFIDEGRMIYMGEAAGFVIRLEDKRAVYFAGDTALFADMQLIGEMYRPAIAFLPIGDRFTMGPEAAARACAPGRGAVVPMHWDFPSLSGTPSALRPVSEGVDVLELRPGETAEYPAASDGRVISFCSIGLFGGQGSCVAYHLRTVRVGTRYGVCGSSPVDCIHPGRMNRVWLPVLYIHPDDASIAVVRSRVPIEAIFALDETPEKWSNFIPVNAFFKVVRSLRSGCLCGRSARFQVRWNPCGLRAGFHAAQVSSARRPLLDCPSRSRLASVVADLRFKIIRCLCETRSRALDAFTEAAKSEEPRLAVAAPPGRFARRQGGQFGARQS